MSMISKLAPWQQLKSKPVQPKPMPKPPEIVYIDDPVKVEIPVITEDTFKEFGKKKNKKVVSEED